MVTIGEARELARYLVAACDELDVLANKPDALTDLTISLTEGRGALIVYTHDTHETSD